MGAWGTGISSNDSYADVYDEFADLYNEGMDVPEITQRLVTKNREIINSEDSSSFWFAIANAQWEYKALDSYILSRVEKIIQSGEDITFWKAAGASEKDIKAREKVLSNFLLKIQTEKEKPKKRAKKKLHSSIFKKGDCLTYIMNNGNYGGAFVLSDEQNTVSGQNIIAITKIDQLIKPDLDDFKKAYIYIRREKHSPLSKNWIEQPQIAGFFGFLLKKEAIEIEVIGNLLIKNNYEIKAGRYYGWINLVSAVPFDNEYIKINGAAKSTLKLSTWTEISFLNWIKNLFN